jgi:hypothetical protein
MIGHDDFNKYIVQTEAWIARNERTIALWKASDVDLKNQTFYEQAEALLQNVYHNLEVLKLYREYPSKIGRLLHQSDQYVLEVISFVDETLGYFTGWMQNNASRFSLRVDTVILLK